ncbi:MAG: nuclear transport factor 2 family protein [Sphingosinicella sp.]|nr:nuclear transport factor 2 family protein [Sphingosinicella sp.]
MSEPEITPVIEKYFDALHHSDAYLMEQVMHPDAVYATADEASPLIRNRADYLEVLRSRISPAKRGEVRADRIVSIETAGERTAMVRALCSIGERQFTDFLSLIRVEDQWRIIAKIFAIDFVKAED